MQTEKCKTSLNEPVFLVYIVKDLVKGFPQANYHGSNPVPVMIKNVVVVKIYKVDKISANK